MKTLRIITLVVLVTFLAILSTVLFSFKKIENIPVTLNVVYDTTAYVKSKDTILYKPANTLVWKDFVALPKENAETVANSAVGFKFDAGILSQNKNVTVNITVSSFFVKTKSWGKDKHKNAYILNHEQRHFDLARYGAELFRRELLKQPMTNRNIAQCLQNAYKISWEAYLKLQAAYDSETNHSINKAQQEMWDKKITNLLAECK